MASNIQIVGKILDNSVISRFNSQDTNLIASTTVQGSFSVDTDYIEQYLYDAAKNILNVNYNYRDYKLPSDSFMNPSDGTLPDIEIDPVNDVQNLGYSSGEFNIQYNFFQNIISDNNQGLFIQEISSDRTEIRAASTTIADTDLKNQVNKLTSLISGSNFVVDFLLNFGQNNQYVGVNVALDGNEVLFKLYQPLPTNIDVKSTFWVVIEKVNPYQFDINLDKIILPPPSLQLRGPNFDIDTYHSNNVGTAYQNYDELLLSLQTINSSSYQKLLSLTTSQSISINVDYTDYTNFSFFGSSTSRLSNFYNKVQQVENYNILISSYTSLSGSNPSLILEINNAVSNVNNVISDFDGYEYYLYFESSSYTWPKISSVKPYELQSTGSAEVITWYQGQLSTASYYDQNNLNALTNSTPDFILDDENNAPYLVFLNLMGQYFDNIWIYIKSITDLYIANNNLNQGISKDLVYFALQSLGVNLYNSVGNEDINLFLVGSNTGSADFDNNFTPSGSFLNNVPKKDLLAELYKRIYHNLPLLLKTKGTSAGLRTFISTFGITGSILNVKEYGGYEKAEYLQGYNNDKVRIESNIITGSLLSPFITLQSETTTESLFRSEDEHYVDISFSPETQMNTYVSSAIAIQNPTWSIDDFIGDPGYLYSSSYETLKEEQPKYMHFTASYMDYGGFIRLIQFFDNSLFKMLKDYVPARANLSTGVTIESPILERNKVTYARLNESSNIKELDADYYGPKLVAEYTDLYVNMGGDKSAYFNGEITGSEYNWYNKFKINNYNPYALSYAKVTLPDPYGNGDVTFSSKDMARFNNSDFNVLLNNVLQNRMSLTRKDIEVIPYSDNELVISPAYLQDSYENLQSYQRSRHTGVKLTSKTYTFYTSGSYTGSDGRTVQIGDISYGKTAAVDQQTLKFAWVKNIGYSNLNFFDKTQVNIKYLVDPSGSLTELSSHNYNLFEVQNTFRSGDPIIVSITDVLKPSNQTTLNGNKIIWKGGFAFNPILFRELNETLYFNWDTPKGPFNQLLGIKALNNDLNEYKWLAGSSAAPPPTALATNNIATGYFFLTNNQPVNASMAVNQFDSSSWIYQSVPKINLDTTSIFSFVRANGSTFTYDGNGFAANPQRTPAVYAFDIVNFNDPTYNTETDPSTYQPINGNYYYKVVRNSNYSITGSIRVGFKGADAGSTSEHHGDGAAVFRLVGIAEYSDTPQDDTSWTLIGHTNLTPVNGLAHGNLGYNSTESLLWFDGDMTSEIQFNLGFQGVTPTLTAGNYIRFRFYWIDLRAAFVAGCNYIDFKIYPESSFEVYDANTLSQYYQYTGSYGQIPTLFTLDDTYQTDDTLVFSNVATQFFNSSSFDPIGQTATNYSPVIDQFSIEVGDLVRLGIFNSPSSQLYEVIQVSFDDVNQNYRIVLNRSVDPAVYSNAQNFAILRPTPDETSIILDFNKAAGEVSQTLLIPFNIDLVVKGNIGNVSAQLETTIGANNIVSGGSF